MPRNHPLRLKAFKTAIAPNGQDFTFTFVRSDGAEFAMTIPFKTSSQFILDLESQAEEALRMVSAASGRDQRFLFPMRKRRLTNFAGATTTKNEVLLTIELDGRMRLDVSASRDQIDTLVQKLQLLLDDPTRNDSS